MRIAIIHDDLMRRGGAEKVALTLVKAFPEADFYTLCYNPALTYEEFKQYKVHTSWYQKIAFSEASMKLLFYPLGIWAMNSLQLDEYDVVLISTTFCSKYIKLKPNTLLITYCHTPFRLAWFPETYKSLTKNPLLRFLMFKLICPRLRVLDKNYALRTDYFIANSNVTCKRIQHCYTDKKPITLLHPPVMNKSFQVSDKTKNYYLMVTRFQPYKKIDLVIDTFNDMPDKKLIIVGTGILEKELRSKAGKNVEFAGVVDNSRLAMFYANCKALIFPQAEDFGITPLEANASGRPVIAYAEGGVLETMIPYKKGNPDFTAVFFRDQRISDLKEAIALFETVEDQVNSNFICQNAERFSETSFMKNIRQLVEGIAKANMSSSKDSVKPNTKAVLAL